LIFILVQYALHADGLNWQVHCWRYEMTTVVMGRNGNSTLLSVLLALGRAKREARSASLG